MRLAPTPHAEISPPDGSALLVVDAPNVDAVLGGMLGRAPRRSERFDARALSTWIARECETSAERTIFTNVPDPLPPGLEGWIKHLVEDGWRVYARPKVRRDDDIDDAMVAYLSDRPWEKVVVFSHDSACFAAPLTSMARAGTHVTVLGFRECAGRLPFLEGVNYIDAEDVPGLYRQAPPRVRIGTLPAAGGWIEQAVV